MLVGSLTIHMFSGAGIWFWVVWLGARGGHGVYEAVGKEQRTVSPPHQGAPGGSFLLL